MEFFSFSLCFYRISNLLFCIAAECKSPICTIPNLPTWVKPKNVIRDSTGCYLSLRRSNHLKYDVTNITSYVGLRSEFSSS